MSWQDEWEEHWYEEWGDDWDWTNWEEDGKEWDKYAWAEGKASLNEIDPAGKVPGKRKGRRVEESHHEQCKKPKNTETKKAPEETKRKRDDEQKEATASASKAKKGSAPKAGTSVEATGSSEAPKKTKNKDKVANTAASKDKEKKPRRSSKTDEQKDDSACHKVPETREGQHKAMIKFAKMFEQFEDVEEVKQGIRDALTTTSHVRLNIYWTRNSVGIRSHLEERDVAFISLGGARGVSKTARIAITCKAADILVPRLNLVSFPKGMKSGVGDGDK